MRDTQTDSQPAQPWPAEPRTQISDYRHFLQEVLVSTPNMSSRPAPIYLHSSAALADFLRPFIAGQPVEHVVAVLVDPAMAVVGVLHLGMATSASVLSDLKRLVRGLAHCNADGVFIAHNHPGGALAFSDADRQMTWRTAAICRLLGATLHDHLILSSLTASFIAAGEAHPSDLDVELSLDETVNALVAETGANLGPGIDL